MSEKFKEAFAQLALALVELGRAMAQEEAREANQTRAASARGTRDRSQEE